MTTLENKTALALLIRLNHLGPLRRFCAREPSKILLDSGHVIGRINVTNDANDDIFRHVVFSSEFIDHGCS